MSRTSNNTWGMGISESNDIFISTANNTHSGYYGIPDRHTRDVEGLYARGIEKIDGHYLFHPITRNFRQVDVFGGFTAAAGHALYTARSFPEEYWNKVALVCEPTGHLLHKAVLARDGAGFTESDGWNLLSSADEWVSPVAADVGPDGAVWILDWYNFIIQHNPIPEGFENGLGNAHVNPLRDKQRGRIYKLVHEGAPTYDPISLDPSNSEQLVAMLSSDNMLWRMHAQRLLVEGDHTSVKGDVINLIKDRTKDAQGLNNPALHGIWTLHGLGLVNQENQDILDVISEALTHPAAGVRKGAIQSLPNSTKTFEAMITSELFRDEDAVVQLAASNKLWKLPSTELLAETLVTLSNDENYLSDVWLARSVYVAAVKHKDYFIKALVKSDPNVLTTRAAIEEIEDINYADPTINTADWSDIPVPKWLNHTNIEELTGFNGIMWYKTTIDLTADQVSYPASWHIGGAYNKDHLFVNGQFVSSGMGWDVKRNYKIKSGILKPGKNTIAIKIEGGGGIGGNEGDVFLQLGDDMIPMAGTWKYKIEKIISSARSEYADGDDIIDVFLKNYSPYANSYAKDLDAEGGLVDRKVTIKTIKDQMKYDITQIDAVAGEVLEITFVNNDAMQHNLLVIEPGSLRMVGREGEAFAKAKYAADRNYVPDMKEILHYIPILNPGEEYKLRIKLPDEPGDYPYVCTFPGHWQSMNGVIKVKSKENLQ